MAMEGWADADEIAFGQEGRLPIPIPYIPPSIYYNYPYDDYHEPERPDFRESMTSSTWRYRGRRVLDFVTGQKFGFLVAIFVIVGLQFQGTILLWIQRWRSGQVSVWDLLVDLWWTWTDYLRAGWHMVAEAGRTSLTLMPTAAGTQQADRRRLRRRLHRRQHRSTNSIPELEDVSTATHLETPHANQQHSMPNTDAPLEQSAEGSLAVRPPGKKPKSKEKDAMADSTGVKLLEKEIAPAFLNENDYPEGWVVYHHILGVVTKKEADEFDRKSAVQTLNDNRGKVVMTARENGLGELTNSPTNCENLKATASTQEKHWSSVNMHSEGASSMPVLHSIAANG